MIRTNRRTPSPGRFLRASVAALAFAALASCETNPAGRSAFTGFMSSSEELRIGQQQHPLITAEFGGEHEDQKIRGYADALGQKLAAASERPDLKWTFTVLNSDIVNAFALPGGFIYVTSGLLALANSEAELAGVIGHEIGHVTARHTAERYSQTVGAQVLLGVLGAATGGLSQGIADYGAMAFLASYSRDQESEADTLGIRYIAKRGYDPMGVSSFMNSLEMNSQLEDKLSGRSGSDRYSLLATHPRAAKRVIDSAAEARRQMPAGPVEIGATSYLHRIDGLYYGGDRDNGFVRNREFVHPKLRFRFEVPPNFRLFNSPTQVSAIGPDKARILFDMTTKDTAGSTQNYLTRVWARGLNLREVETLTVNGLEAASASARASVQGGGAVELLLVAIRLDKRIVYRFLFVASSAQAQSLREGFRQTAQGFKIMTEAEATKQVPYRIRLHQVRAGETAEKIAVAMPFDDYKVERFMTLNGLRAGEQPKTGALVKIVDD